MSTTVRRNLMNQKGYSPYCGANGHCPLPRTHFDGEQFICKHCGWRSEFPKEFIKEYKSKWKIKKTDGQKLVEFCDKMMGHGYEPGQPCDHPGCCSHVSHPCEGCGRTGCQ